MGAEEDSAQKKGSGEGRIRRSLQLEFIFLSNHDCRIEYIGLPVYDDHSGIRRVGGQPDRSHGDGCLWRPVLDLEIFPRFIQPDSFMPLQQVPVCKQNHSMDNDHVPGSYHLPGCLDESSYLLGQQGRPLP